MWFQFLTASLEKSLSFRILVHGNWGRLLILTLTLWRKGPINPIVSPFRIPLWCHQVKLSSPLLFLCVLGDWKSFLWILDLKGTWYVLICSGRTIIKWRHYQNESYLKSSAEGLFATRKCFGYVHVSFLTFVGLKIKPRNSDTDCHDHWAAEKNYLGLSVFLSDLSWIRGTLPFNTTTVMNFPTTMSLVSYLVTLQNSQLIFFIMLAQRHSKSTVTLNAFDWSRLDIVIAT